MGLRRQLGRLLNRAIAPAGYRLVARSRLYEWQLEDGVFFHTYRDGPLPPGAEDYLRPENPRLRELSERYARFDQQATAPLVWTEGLVRPADLQHFRGDNAFVWQVRGRNMNRLGHALCAYYLRNNDPKHFLDRVAEDGAFGAFAFEVDGRTVSRDLLDSVNELAFLERHLGLSGWPRVDVLDIGAGYGRLAHRSAQILGNLSSYLCTDGVAVSTFLNEYYLRFRGLEGRARAVPLDEIEQCLSSHHVDLAINIHSFSECRAAAIAWWVRLLARAKVRFLFIVPNAVDGTGRRLLNQAGEDFGTVIEAHGYRPLAHSPKYLDPVVQDYGLAPTHYHLFELR